MVGAWGEKERERESEVARELRSDVYNEQNMRKRPEGVQTPRQREIVSMSVTVECL